MNKLEVATRTKDGAIVVNINSVYREVEMIMHPIKNKKLYCFISDKKILPDTYPLHGILSKKHRYANIFNEETQNEIKRILN